MTRVFISHCSEDNYFVDFLVELLRYHHVEIWVDRSDLAPGRDFPSGIGNALATCDSMIVIVSRHSSRSQWVAREVVHFKAANPDRTVIPLVLDAGADPDEIYEGFGLVTQLRCYESFLESLRKLLQMLDRTLFPEANRRKISDRRSDDRRQEASDRRRTPIRRLRVALDDYIEATGYDLLRPIDRFAEVSRIVYDLMADSSPLHSFNFNDRKTGEQITVSLDWLQRTALKSWRSKKASRFRWDNSPASPPAGDTTGAAYIIDDIIDELEKSYMVSSKDRRAEDRRSDAPRRTDDSLSGGIEVSVSQQQDSSLV